MSERRHTNLVFPVSESQPFIQSFFREAVMLAAEKPADLSELVYIWEPYIINMSENCQILN